MRVKRHVLELIVALAVTVGMAGIAGAQGGGNGRGASPQIKALQDDVAALQGEVSALEDELHEIEALSDLDCVNNAPYFTRPGLAVNRYGQWDCAKPVYVEEEVEVAVGDRYAYASVRCPSPLLPISGGTGANSWTVPPDTGSLVLADTGWGPNARDWHAIWVSISAGGATRATTLTVGVFCM